MIFTDYFFIPLLMLTVCLYYIFPLSGRWVLLLLTSILFYCTWGFELLPFLLIGVFLTWILALWMGSRYVKCDFHIEQIEDKKKQLACFQAVKRKNKKVLWVGVCLILFFLFYAKGQKIIAESDLFSPIGAFFSAVYSRIVIFFPEFLF